MRYNIRLYFFYFYHFIARGRAHSLAPPRTFINRCFFVLELCCLLRIVRIRVYSCVLIVIACVYMYFYIYICVCVYACMYVSCIRVCLCVSLYIYIYIFIYNIYTISWNNNRERVSLARFLAIACNPTPCRSSRKEIIRRGVFRATPLTILLPTRSKPYDDETRAVSGCRTNERKSVVLFSSLILFLFIFLSKEQRTRRFNLSFLRFERKVKERRGNRMVRRSTESIKV